MEASHWLGCCSLRLAGLSGWREVFSSSCLIVRWVTPSCQDVGILVGGRGVAGQGVMTAPSTGLLDSNFS